MALHFRLVIDKEECLILLDGAADCAAELVQIELFPG